jgi:hypothetical protein
MTMTLWGSTFNSHFCAKQADKCDEAVPLVELKKRFQGANITHFEIFSKEGCDDIKLHSHCQDLGDMAVFHL